MRIPLTKYGLPQVAVYPVIVMTGMLVVALVWPASVSVWGLAALEAMLAAILAWALAFFRDPHRRITADDAVLAAPADGRVTDIETLDENEFIDGPILRIGIFLSIFNTHINRAPCEGTV